MCKTIRWDWAAQNRVLFLFFILCKLEQHCREGFYVLCNLFYCYFLCVCYCLLVNLQLCYLYYLFHLKNSAWLHCFCFCFCFMSVGLWNELLLSKTSGLFMISNIIQNQIADIFNELFYPAVLSHSFIFQKKSLVIFFSKQLLSDTKTFIMFLYLNKWKVFWEGLSKSSIF